MNLSAVFVHLKSRRALGDLPPFLFRMDRLSFVNPTVDVGNSTSCETIARKNDYKRNSLINSKTIDENYRNNCYGTYYFKKNNVSKNTVDTGSLFLSGNDT